MICKIKHGSDFGGCLDYITGKHDRDKHAKVLMHSDGIPLLDNKTVARIFEAYATKGGNTCKQPVGHFAYSFHRNDTNRLTDEFMCQIAREHMELMGIRDTEFVITRHYDTDHEHIHLTFSRVDKNGKVISDSMEKERNARICKYLTLKYGLYMAKGKERVNRDRLRGKEKLKYQFYDKAMRCRQQSANWPEFDKALRNEGLKMRFHFNNVTGKLMGVVFTDGKHTFSGKQLDNALKLSSLVAQFGDPKEITHCNVCSWYEQYKLQLHYHNDWQGCRAIEQRYPDIDKVFPDGKLPEFEYPTIENLLSHRSAEIREALRDEYAPSKDGKSVFIPVGMLFDLLLQPYAPQLSMGGGGGGNNQGWRDLDDDDKNKYRFHFNFAQSHSKKPQVKRK